MKLVYLKGRRFKIMSLHKFKKGDIVKLRDDFLDDNTFVKKNSQGTVSRYDDCLVVVSLQHYVTICPHESDLEIVSSVDKIPKI
jgi:hypothetical protein